MVACTVGSMRHTRQSFDPWRTFSENSLLLPHICAIDRGNGASNYAPRRLTALVYLLRTCSC